MADLLWKFREVLTGQGDPARKAREALLYAQRRNRKLELERILPGPPANGRPTSDNDRPGDRTMRSTIEQVRENDLVISQPMVGAYVRPLASGEPLIMGFNAPEGWVHGETKTLSRIRIPTGGQRMLYGYRLALPQNIRNVDRRDHHRVPVAYDLAPQAEVFTSADRATTGPITGVLLDLSASGTRLLATRLDQTLKPGDKVFLKVHLPDPVGLLYETVRVTRVERRATSGQAIISMEFLQEIEPLDRLVRALDIKRAQRARAG